MWLDQKLIDQYTRGIFTIMHFYNPNLKILSYVRVGFEIDANGLIIPSNNYLSFYINSDP
jgi:hypothetical protein